MPGGEAWGEDYAGTNPNNVATDDKARMISKRISQCGVDGQVTNSSWVAGFRRNLVVVLTGPYSWKSAAPEHLSAARNCDVSGYTKFGVWNEPGAE
jgi:hypothetical protein